MLGKHFLMLLTSFLSLSSNDSTMAHGSDGKESACNVGDLPLIPGLGRSLEGRYGNPLQYSCLENPIDRVAWQVTVQGDTTERLSLSHGPPGHAKPSLEGFRDVWGTLRPLCQTRLSKSMRAYSIWSQIDVGSNCSGATYQQILSLS